MLPPLIIFLAIGCGLVGAQDGKYELESSWPHDYPGMPEGGFSPEWQDCELHISLLLHIP